MRLSATLLLVGALALAPQSAGAFSSPGCFRPPTSQRVMHAELVSLNIAVSEHGPAEERACAYYARGLLLMLQGDEASAIDDFGHAINWIDGFADAYAARGDAYAALGDATHAAADYAVADATKADSPKDFASRCWVRALRGAPLDRAQADCDQAIRMLPNDRDALVARCLVHYRSGRFADAMTDCAAAMASSPNNAAALFLRALAEQRLAIPAAAADLATARALNPSIDETFAVYGIKPG